MPETALFLDSRTAATRLGYASMDSFYDAVKSGYIAGAVKRGSGQGRPGGRWVFEAAALAYTGPVYRPRPAAERLEADRLGRVAARREAAAFVNPFASKRRNAAA